MPPLLTILLSCHNHAKYLPDLFSSLYYSRFQDFDLILSDDCSTDGSQEVIKAWSNLLPMKVFFHQKNQGGNGRENIKFLFNQDVKTKYLMLLDTDDWIACDQLERSIAVLEAGASAVHSDIVMCDQDGKISFAAWWKQILPAAIPNPTPYEFEILSNRVFICTLIAKTEVYKKAFDFELAARLKVFLGDYFMAVRLCHLLKDEGGIAYIDAPLAYYRNRPDSESHKNYETHTLPDTVHIMELARSGEILEGLL
jgi:glycosyltransferase involved in cell wall biosynthesis